MTAFAIQTRSLVKTYGLGRNRFVLSTAFR